MLPTSACAPYLIDWSPYVVLGSGCWSPFLYWTLVILFLCFVVRLVDRARRQLPNSWRKSAGNPSKLAR
jgi:hypothetical protein